MNVQFRTNINFPPYSGIRCLMMPYIQGDPESVPVRYRTGYEAVIESLCTERGRIGFLTIDESPVAAGSAHRGKRAKFGRALHTEAGLRPNSIYAWGKTPGWGGAYNVVLDYDTQILLVNNLDGSCALWDARHADTSDDGDIGDKADLYPYADAILMKAGDVHQIGILTPHESLPVKNNYNRQFIRVVGEGVYGREPYFTQNPIMGEVR